LQPAGFAEFCHSLAKNTTLETLIVEHNPLRDEGAVALAGVIEEHPMLRELNAELCEIADAGARALFEVIQTSKSMRKVTVKNNLIRDGLCISKAIAVNTRIHALNVDYNDIPFKVFSEIQKQVLINYRTWKNGQKVKTEEELEEMRRIQATLQNCREAIVHARELVLLKTEQVAALKEELQKVEAAKAAHLDQLDQELVDITKQANDLYAGFRAEMDEQGSIVAGAETDYAQLELKKARELERFKAEIKLLSTTERGITEATTSNEQELVALAEKRREAKDKYIAAVHMLESSFQIAKLPPMPEDFGDALNEGVEKGKAKGKKKGKGSKKKGAKAQDKPNTPDSKPAEETAGS
jgi:hypothetical protein